MPFVRVRDLHTRIDKTLATRLIRENNNYFLFRTERTLEKQKGYRPEADSSARYVGSPNEIYLRFRVSRPGDFSFGVTAEKDAGEKIQWKPKAHYSGMDFFSYHLQVQNKGWIKNLVIGDYLAQFGQGITLGGGFGMGKGAEAITTIRRSNLGFLPYTSLNESNFFRGIAGSILLRKNLFLHGFFSGLSRDARIAPDSSADEYSFISSFAVTGYHRTASELATRKQITETNNGAVLNYKTSTLDAGLIFHHTHFSKALVRNPTLYNQFSFNGDRNTNVSAFLNYTWNNFTFFSELAQTCGPAFGVATAGKTGSAVVAGLLASISQKLDISLLYRNYKKDFYSFYSNALSENTLPQNESGVYWGWKYAFSKKYFLAGYIDLFHFPWLRYRAYAPSEGSEWLLRFNYQPSRSALFFVEVREESKIRNLENGNNLYQTGPGTKRNYWINCDYAATSKLNFKTRAQFSTYTLNGKTTHGFALLYDVAWNAGRFSLATRYALFHTEDYDNRLYLYERDVWLAFSFPAYYGTGVHQYALVQFRLAKGADLAVRWSHTRYTDRQEVGSGGETINGNVRNDIKLQVKIKLPSH
jgi:hypothetical protein